MTPGMLSEIWAPRRFPRICRRLPPGQIALGAPFSAFRGPPRSRRTPPAATNGTGRPSCVLARPLAPSFPMKTWLGTFFCRRAARSPSRSAPPRSPKSGRSRAVRVGDARRRAPARVLMRPVRVRLCGDVKMPGCVKKGAKSALALKSAFVLV